MNIQNIQLAQGLYPTVEERTKSRKENTSSQDTASEPQINVPDAQNKPVDKPKSSGKEDLMAVVYPPFFPMGKTQDILKIKGVEQMGGEEAKSASSVRAGEHKATQQKDTSSQTTKTDAGSATQYASPGTDALPKVKEPSVKHENNPGVVIDFKV